MTSSRLILWIPESKNIFREPNSLFRGPLLRSLYLTFNVLLARVQIRITARHDLVYEGPFMGLEDGDGIWR